MPLLSELIADINAEQDMLMLKDRMKAVCSTVLRKHTENYKQYRINMHQTLRTCQAEKIAEPMRIIHIANGTERLMKFKLSEGKKYWKVIQQNPNSEGGYSDASVVAFISFKGEVFKPASWRAPAKGVRFDFRIIKEREAALDPNKAQWTGGSLYYR